MSSADQAELVVLLDDAGRQIGVAPKAEVHHARTPLHLAFSLYVFDEADRLLVTRRALRKATFPGVWTNSVCGHPQPGERLTEAARRRAADEIGLRLPESAVRLALPGFRYRAEQGGVVEHEVCPVLYAVLPAAQVVVDHDPTEVEQARWVDWLTCLATGSGGGAGGGPLDSPWALAQVDQLRAFGPSPAAWPSADPGQLPPAARW